MLSENGFNHDSFIIFFLSCCSLQTMPPSSVTSPSSIHYLGRFLDAQKSAYSTALAELRHGEKVSHWIWFILPQMLPRGSASSSSGAPSERAKTYQLPSKAIVWRYLKHDVLGPRYLACVSLIHDHLHHSNTRLCAQQPLVNETAQKKVVGPRSVGVFRLMGSTVDVHKLYMSLSTFVLAALENCVAAAAPESPGDFREASRSCPPPPSSMSLPPSSTLLFLLTATLLEVLLSISLTADSIAGDDATRGGASLPFAAQISAKWRHRDSLLEILVQLTDEAAGHGKGKRMPGGSPDLFAEIRSACHLGVSEAWDAAAKE